MNPCPICARAMPSNAVMCLEHYALAPWPLQRQLLVRRNQLARALNGKSPRLLADASRLYRQACNTAIEAVRVKVERRGVTA